MTSVETKNAPIMSNINPSVFMFAGESIILFLTKKSAGA
jgi:hypothetical protein